MMGALLTLGYTALFLLVIRKWRWLHIPGLPHGTASALFMVKILCGTALWAIYTYHYPDRSTADIFKYFDDGNVMHAALPEHPDHYLRMLTGATAGHDDIDRTYYRTMNNWYRRYENQVYNDTHTMIRFNAVVRLFSFGHYHVHTVFASFLALIGLVGLYRAFVTYLAGRERWLFGAVFLVPSVLLWASGPLKEALLLFGLGLFTFGLVRVAERRMSPGIILLTLGCLLLLCILKVYVLLSLLPGALALCWCGTKATKGVGLRYLVVLAIGALVALNTAWFVPQLDILEIMRIKQQDFIGVAISTASGSRIELPPLDNEVDTFVKLAPHALYVTYISPFLAIRTGLLGALGALENLLIPMALILAWRHRRAWAQVQRPLLYFCLSYLLLLSLVMGWTTPVIGALVRYRVPLLPFLFIALLLLTRPAEKSVPTSPQEP